MSRCRSHLVAAIGSPEDISRSSTPRWRCCEIRRTRRSTTSSGWSRATISRTRTSLREEYFVLKRSDVEDTFGVLAFVDAGADTDLLDPDDLAGRLLFYSIVLGGGKGRRVAFVSKSNPARTLGKGVSG